jgi:hypothetical protein
VNAALGPRESAPLGTWALRVAALAVLALTALPVAEWVGLPRRELRPPWRATVEFWLWGTALVAGLGAVLHVLLNRTRFADGAAGLWQAVGRWPESAWRIGLVLWIAGWGVAAAHLVFSGNPGLVDSIVQLFQAKVFASGRLWAPAPAHAEFFLTQHMIVADGKFFSQFPPGHPAVVALALRMGLPVWAVSPGLAAGAAALAVAGLRRALDTRTARLVGALLALSPFLLFMAGEQMSHVTALFFLCLAFYALVRGRAPRASAAWFALCGVALGLAFATRPLDAVAWAVPFGAVLLVERRGRALAAAVAGGLPVAALVFAYNAATTGDPFLFGYVYLWGKSHALGFHTDPWGDPYGPVQALAFLNLDLRRLSLYAFEWPVPLAVPIAAALWRWPRGLDRAALALAGAGAAVVVANGFYWHHGLYLGPRMLYTAIPGTLLVTALGLRALDESAGRWRGAVRWVWVGCVVTAATQTVPARAETRIEGHFSMKLHPDRQAREAGITNAVIFVPESWASGMLARLWAWGVPRDEVEQSYRRVDSCELDEVLREADRRHAAGGDSATVRGWLRAELAARRARYAGYEIPMADTLPDRTLRLDPRRPLTPRCRQLLAQDLEGFSLYTPFLPLNAPTLDGDLVFARDLRERDTLLIRRYPGRAYYLYTPGTAAPNVTPRFVPLAEARPELGLDR